MRSQQTAHHRADQADQGVLPGDLAAAIDLIEAWRREDLAAVAPAAARASSPEALMGAVTYVAASTLDVLAIGDADRWLAHLRAQCLPTRAG